jgi:hypothetical protein
MATIPASQKRLTLEERRHRLRPLRKAEQLTRCHLYWLPVDFPAKPQQRQWLLAFFEAFSQMAHQELGLQPQLFLQMKTVYPDLLDGFIKTAPEFNPLFGLSRRPEARIPPLPDMRYVEQLQKGHREFKFGDQMADYCYWFVARQEQKQRQMFLGYGGLTTIFIRPDPGATPPPPSSIPPGVKRSPIFEPILKQWNLEQGRQVAFALKSEFLKKSKEFFGRGLEDDPQFPGFLYVLPLLSTRDFFDQPDEEAAHWFELFDLYVNESAPDKGIVLASKEDSDEKLAAILEKLKHQGMRYPEPVDFNDES